MTKMNKKIAKISMITLTLCAAVLWTAPERSCAQDTPSAPAASRAKPAKHNATSSASLPFHGTVTAVDANAMTLTVGKRAFTITSETKITKDGKSAVLADGAAGESVSGAYKKNAAGALDATTIHFTSKPADKKKNKNAPATGK
jgi:hypothetical protein